MSQSAAVAGAGQVMRYVAVGLGANALVLALYYALSLGFAVAPKPALVCASLVGFAVSFLAQRI